MNTHISNFSGKRASLNTVTRYHSPKETLRERRWLPLASRLDEIPGLGHHRQKQLLGHFRSVDYIKDVIKKIFLGTL